MNKIETIEDYFQWRQTQVVYEERGIKFPVLNAVLVNRSLVQANDYNPNHVAKDKMKLLQTSIVENGFCFGIVSIYDDELQKFVIIDGDHRNQISGEKWLKLTYVPLVILNHQMSKRLSATVQFNKARGVHQIEGNAGLVRRMVELGISDIDICKALGMEPDEVLRFKRNVKIVDVYKDLNFSNSWEIQN
jgi:hypothetical protein